MSKKFKQGMTNDVSFKFTIGDTTIGGSQLVLSNTNRIEPVTPNTIFSVVANEAVRFPKLMIQNRDSRKSTKIQLEKK